MLIKKSDELYFQTQYDPIENEQVASTSDFQQEVPTKRKFMKPSSRVWNHFTKIKDPNDGSERTKCTYCSKEYVYSSRNDTSL